MLSQLKSDLQKLRNPKQARLLARFFKTGKGGYGKGDKFLGIAVPKLRRIAGKYKSLALLDLQELLAGSIHEYRFTAVVILIGRYQKADQKYKARLVKLYLKNIDGINNWDLVDLSAPKILGDWLLERDQSLLYKLAGSSNLWKRRIAIMATMPFIKGGRFTDTLKIVRILLLDPHDLIHKACGWALREVGKINQKAEEDFLIKHYQKMPRTMLRYAIEKFDKKKRQFYY